MGCLPSSTQEKRLAIDVAAMAEIAAEYDEENPKRTFLWVPTWAQCADHLTKVKPAHQLREYLMAGWMSLQSTEAA